jgi:type IV secretory pathway VirB10-like protein
MNTHQLLLALAFCACSSSVFAQWQWIDETGRKVFSDRPPPAHISPKQIVKQPPGTPQAVDKVLYPSAVNELPAPVAPVAPVASPTPASPAPEPSAKEDAENAAHDKALEAQRKADEAERKKREALQAKARQENCQRARAAQASLQSGGLVTYVNEKGERGIMTEERRQADLQRAQKIVKDNCK